MESKNGRRKTGRRKKAVTALSGAATLPDGQLEASALPNTLTAGAVSNCPTDRCFPRYEFNYVCAICCYLSVYKSFHVGSRQVITYYIPSIQIEKKMYLVVLTQSVTNQACLQLLHRLGYNPDQ